MAVAARGVVEKLLAEATNQRQTDIDINATIVCIANLYAHAALVNLESQNYDIIS